MNNITAAEVRKPRRHNPATGILCHRSQSGVELGYYVAAVTDPGHVFLSVYDRGYLQPQNRRLGSSSR